MATSRFESPLLSKKLLRLWYGYIRFGKSWNYTDFCCCWWSLACAAPLEAGYPRSRAHSPRFAPLSCSSALLKSWDRQVPYQAQPIFAFLGRDGFPAMLAVGLSRFDLRDPPASASQCRGYRWLHCAWPILPRVYARRNRLRKSYYYLFQYINKR